MISPPPSPVTIWARCLSLPVKTTQEFLSTENFNRNSLKPASCACRISNSRTTLYKSLRAAFRILPSKRSGFARAKRPDLSFNLQPQTLQPQPRLASLTIQGGAPGTDGSRRSNSRRHHSRPMARSLSPPSIPETIPSSCAMSDSNPGSSRNTSRRAERFLSLLRMPRWKPLPAN